MLKTRIFSLYSIFLKINISICSSADICDVSSDDSDISMVSSADICDVSEDNSDISMVSSADSKADETLKNVDLPLEVQNPTENISDSVFPVKRKSDSSTPPTAPKKIKQQLTERYRKENGTIKSETQTDQVLPSISLTQFSCNQEKTREDTSFKKTVPSKIHKKDIKTDFLQIHENFKTEIKACLKDFDSFKSFINKHKSCVELELIEKYYKSNDKKLIEDMKQYFKSSFEKMDDDFLKILFNVLNRKKESINSTLDYKSELKTEYKNAFQHWKKDDFIFQASNKIDQIFKIKEEVFSNVTDMVTFSEGINEILTILEHNRKGNLKKQTIKHSEKNLLPRKIILYLIDDLVIKLQYGILFIADCFKSKGSKIDFSLIYAFILKQQIFIEKIRKYLIKISSNKKGLDKIELNQEIQNSNENFGYSNETLVITLIISQFSKKISHAPELPDFQRFGFTVIARLKILNTLVVQIKKILNPRSSTPLIYTGKDLEYDLLIPFLNPQNFHHPTHN